MIDTPARNEIVMAFLSKHAGVYRYRLWFSRTMFWFGIASLLGFFLGIYHVFYVGQNSIYETIRVYIVLVFCPYLAWSCIVVARNFKEVRIDGEGISILPFGLRIAAHDLKEIRHSENYAGAGTIELELKFPYWIFHVVAWSLGRTVTIAFNKRILTRVSASS